MSPPDWAPGPRKGPPPLRPMGLVLRRNGRFEHDGVPVTNRKLHSAFLRGVAWAEAEGVFVVTLGHFRGQLEVEDVAWWVVAYDAECGEIQLTDRSTEILEPASLTTDADGALRCSVKGGGFAARFTHGAQEMLLDALQLRDDQVWLRVGAVWVVCAGVT